MSTVHQRLPGSPEGGGFYNRVEFEQALVGYSHGGHLPQRGVSGASDLFFCLACLFVLTVRCAVKTLVRVLVLRTSLARSAAG